MTVSLSHDDFIAALKEQSCFANICTEPGMIAFMAAKAASLTTEIPQEIEVHLSAGILKNALSAGLPHTSRRGPDVAAAAGAVGRCPEKGLTILGSLTQDQMNQALSLVAAGMTKVKWDSAHDGVYGKCIVRTQNHRAEVVVQGAHTRITEQRLDGDLVASRLPANKSDSALLRGCTLAHLMDTVATLDADRISWLLEGAESCHQLAVREAAIGRKSAPASPLEACHALKLDDELLSSVAGLVAKAVFARMSGIPWPVLTSGGSGNQGIMVSVPVLLMAQHLNVDREKTVRALALSHGVNMLVKAYTGEVSSSCGGVSASAGVAAAVCWLLGGNYTRVSEAVTETLAALFGMVCDGAKESCALKASSAVTTGLFVGAGVTRSQCSMRDQGAIGESLEETLTRLGELNKKVFNSSDALLLGLLGFQKVG